MASQPSQQGSSVRAEPPGRFAAPIGADRRRRNRLRLAIFILTAAVAALGAWSYREIRRQAPSPDALWAQAQADLREDRLDRAEQAVARLARLRAPTAPDRLVRGQLAVARRRPDEAIAELALVPDDHPLAAQARLLAGQVELRRDRFRFAEDAFRAAIRIDPKLVQAHRELIYIYGFQLRRAELAGEFLALSGLIDLGFKEMFHWGLLRNESWEPSGAAEALARCVAADPGDRWSRLALAENERRMGLLDQAEATLAALGPGDAGALGVRVRIALDRNDESAAERLLASGPPDDSTLAGLRGRMALSRRDAAAALRHFRIAYDVRPESYEALSGLIAAMAIQGDARSAAPLRAIAARRDRLQALIQRAGAKEGRNDPELSLLLGDACAALHRDAEARGWYKVAIARDPLDSRAQRALFRLGGAAADVSRSPGPEP
jgi:tetratricopeptide (TPR) repeat protein